MVLFLSGIFGVKIVQDFLCTYDNMFEFFEIIGEMICLDFVLCLVLVVVISNFEVFIFECVSVDYFCDYVLRIYSVLLCCIW